MPQIRVNGEQLDIVSVAEEIENNPVAIASIATGVTTDLSSIALLDADYLRRDGTLLMTGNLNLDGFNLLTTGNVDGRDVSADGSVLDGHIADLSLHRVINDSGVSTTELFSANKIIADLVLKADVTTLSGHTSSTLNPHAVTKLQVGLGNVEDLQINLTAILPPVATDDSSGGYSIGSRWFDLAADLEYVCLDATATSAVWINTTSVVVPIAINDLSDVANSSLADRHVLVYDNGDTRYENRLLVEADISNLGSYSLTGHTHATTDITSGTFDDALVAETNVTQHAAALSIQPLDSDLTTIAAIPHSVAGNIMISDGSDWISVPVGANNEVLIADSGETEGVIWALPEFIALDDTPASLSGAGGQFVKVNAAEDSLEFVAGEAGFLVDTTIAYTLALSDANNIVIMENVAANDLTIPLDAAVSFPVGTEIRIVMGDTGVTSIIGPSVTINSAGGLTDIASQYSVVTLVRLPTTDEWLLYGDLA